MSSNFSSAKESYAELLVKSGAIQIAKSTDSPFKLRNGSFSPVYVDHAELLCQPETYVPFLDILIGHIDSHFPHTSTVLANVDSKSSPHIVGALAARPGRRQIVASNEATQISENGRNLKFRFPKQFDATDKIVLVDDVFTEDDVTAIKIKEAMGDAAEKRETHLLVGLLRGAPDVCIQQLGKFGIKLHWIATLEDVIDEAWDSFSAKQREVLDLGGL
jgi:orotate phosphoribosyltransferase